MCQGNTPGCNCCDSLHYWTRQTTSSSTSSSTGRSNYGNPGNVKSLQNWNGMFYGRGYDKLYTLLRHPDQNGTQEFLVQYDSSNTTENWRVEVPFQQLLNPNPNSPENSYHPPLNHNIIGSHGILVNVESFYANSQTNYSYSAWIAENGEVLREPKRRHSTIVIRVDGEEFFRRSDGFDIGLANSTNEKAIYYYQLSDNSSHAIVVVSEFGELITETNFGVPVDRRLKNYHIHVCSLDLVEEGDRWVLEASPIKSYQEKSRVVTWGPAYDPDTGEAINIPSESIGWSFSESFVDIGNDSRVQQLFSNGPDIRSGLAKGKELYWYVATSGNGVNEFEFTSGTTYYHANLPGLEDYESEQRREAVAHGWGGFFSEPGSDDPVMEWDRYRYFVDDRNPFVHVYELKGWPNDTVVCKYYTYTAQLFGTYYDPYPRFPRGNNTYYPFPSYISHPTLINSASLYVYSYHGSTEAETENTVHINDPIGTEYFSQQTAIDRWENSVILPSFNSTQFGTCSGPSLVPVANGFRITEIQSLRGSYFGESKSSFVDLFFPNIGGDNADEDRQRLLDSVIVETRVEGTFQNPINVDYYSLTTRSYLLSYKHDFLIGVDIINQVPFFSGELNTLELEALQILHPDSVTTLQNLELISIVSSATTTPSGEDVTFRVSFDVRTDLNPTGPSQGALIAKRLLNPYDAESFVDLRKEDLAICTTNDVTHGAPTLSKRNELTYELLVPNCRAEEVGGSIQLAVANPSLVRNFSTYHKLQTSPLKSNSRTIFPSP